jgi:cellulose synthase/poly-beta-1,6-N-acetylglucosamine synthase-like glycosyltransferase/exo-beta-1,3-glucanase (GH17 family)
MIKCSTMGIVAIVIGLVACLHLGLQSLDRRQWAAPDVDELLPSVSYNRFARSPSEPVPAAQIRRDLAAIATRAKAVRTYSSTHGLELVPKLAGELGLTVTVGAWIDTDKAHNAREIASAVGLAKAYRNVTRIIVGNEVLWRHEMTAAELASLARRAKRDSPVPIAIAEPWQIWLAHPELADAVDVIFAHIIPYWQGFNQKTAVEQSLALYDRLKQTFPGKPIVIGEVGWPSAGYNYLDSVPSPGAQAVVLRTFVARANERGIDYNIVEAIDQPQKLFEGGVGPYWGIFDSSLRPKFAWSGPIVVDADRWKSGMLAVLVGLLLSIPLLGLQRITLGQAVLLAASDHAIGAWYASMLAYWLSHYLLTGEAIAFALSVPLIALMMPIAISRIEELSEVALGPGPSRLLAPRPVASGRFAPKVSIHIPAYREPPEMLVRTLEAVARLDYPSFECVVVINNTPDPALWLPIEARCRELGPRFKLVREDNLKGFKAGALRLAMAHTAADAEIIGVLDADYVVQPDWLKDLVPGFADPAVGLIQAPQDHRDGDRSPVHAAMNAEYAGFFDIGMVERNEANAIVVHGTMCLIRRSALESCGGWSSDTICEDSDLGLSILELGWRMHYTNRRYGHGLLPQDFKALKTQRDRWASGAVQILRKHWRRFLPGASLLGRDQKRAFALGWLGWFGAESIGVGSAVLNLIWAPFVAFNVVTLPNTLLTLPIIACFVLSLVHFAVGYRLRVKVPIGQMLGAMIVFMSMQWTVARAVSRAVWERQAHFHRTPKGKGQCRAMRFPALGEAVLGSLLVAAAMVLFLANTSRVLEVDILAAVMVVQSLPFLSAMALALLEGTRLNDFAYWATGIRDRGRPERAIAASWPGDPLRPCEPPGNKGPAATSPPRMPCPEAA